MQRITRIALDNNNPEKMSLLDQYNALLPLLQPHLTERTFSIFAKPRLIENNQYVGWYTDLEGQPILLNNIADESHKKAVEKTLQTRINDIEVAIKSMPLTSEQQELVSAWLPRIKSLGNQIYVINDDPVIVNTFEPPILPKPVPVPPVAAALPVAARSFWRWWHFLLLGLLLLALLGALWYFFCPFGKEKEPIPPVVITQPAEEKEVEPVVEPPKEPEPVVEPVPEPEPEPVVIPEPKPEPPPAPKVKNDPNCIPKEEIVKNSNPSKMVMVFDNSASMTLTLTESQAAIEQFLNSNPRFMSRQEAEDYERRMTRLPNRLSSSKQVALSSIDKIQQNINIALVTLTRCPTAETTSFYSFGNRGSLKQKIKNLTPLTQNSATPLYSGIQQASQMLDGVKRDDYILVISDGEDNCSRNNICTLANYIATQKPRLKINIVDIAGQHKIDCVAKMTGGKVYIANNHTEMIKQMNKAVADLKISRPICK